ncbi:MAG: hypothetical protein LBL18_06255, partial [Bacteroidales bacterium]|nr:hypothetical protein [Bacteroidales bacterium]
MRNKLPIELIIKQKLKERERSVSWLVRKINYDRSSLNTMLNKQEYIHSSILWRISVTMKIDFFAYYSEKFSEGEYMIWGFDSLLLNRNGMIYLDNGEEFEIYGNGLFQRTKGREDEGLENTEQGIPQTVFMTVDGSEWEGTIENYYLLIDRSGTGEFRPGEIDFYMPDRADSNNVLHFSNIQWDADNNGIDRFCFTYVPVDSILSNRNLVINGGNGEDKSGNDQKRIKGQKIRGEKANAYKVYPNPSEGNFVLEADFAERSDITVKMYSP